MAPPDRVHADFPTAAEVAQGVWCVSTAYDTL